MADEKTDDDLFPPEDFADGTSDAALFGAQEPQPTSQPAEVLDAVATPAQQATQAQPGDTGQPAAAPAPAPQAAEPTPKQEPTGDQPAGKSDAQVPSWRLREEREARDAADRRAAEAEQRFSRLEGQLTALQTQLGTEAAAENLDFVNDPQGAFQTVSQLFDQKLGAVQDRFGKVEQGRQADKLALSRAFAEDQHGADAVQQAIEAAGRAGLDQHFAGQANPFGELMRWNKNQQALSQIGNDPAAYRERLKAEIMAELQNGGAPAAPNGQPAPAMPASAPAATMPHPQAQIGSEIPPTLLDAASSAGAGEQVTPSEGQLFASIFKP